MKGRAAIVAWILVLPFILSSECRAQGAQEMILSATADWVIEDSTQHIPGSVIFEEGMYTIAGNGDDIGGTQDEGFFVYTTASGDFSLSVNLFWDEPGFNDLSKLGLMIRQDPVDPASAYYGVFLRGNDFGDRTLVQIREQNGGMTTVTEIRDAFGNDIAADPAVGIWYRVSRIAAEHLIVFEYSYDGATWLVGHSTTLVLADNLAYGVAITNHEDNEEYAVATLKDVQTGAPQFILVERSITPTLLSGPTNLDVQLRVYNAGTAQEITIEEIIPANWTASNISHNGIRTGSIIRWTYDAPPGESLITYQAVPPADVAENGIWSGTVGDSPITGISVVPFLSESVLANKIPVPYLSNEVVLDGVISSTEYAGARITRFNGEDQTVPGVWIFGGPISATVSEATAYVFHNDENLYVALEVADATLDFATNASVTRFDSVELYWDGNLSRSTTREGNQWGAQMIVMGDGSRAEGDGVPLDIVLNASGGHHSENGIYWNYGARPRPDGTGYVVEFELQKEVMLPSNQPLAGLDIIINGSNEPGNTTREYRYGWYQTKADGSTGDFGNDESAWGVVELVPVTSIQDWSVF